MNGFFGGPALVRGFATNGFGPRDLTPGTTMDNVGGNIYWATSAELQSAIPFVPPDAGLKVSEVDDVILASVNQWTFSPARKKGEPVNCWFNFAVQVGGTD